MDDNDALPSSDQDCRPTARGIQQCLAMLADEAASLGLADTLAALQEAGRVCAVEQHRCMAKSIGLPASGTLMH